MEKLKWKYDNVNKIYVANLFTMEQMATEKYMLLHKSRLIGFFEKKDSAKQVAELIHKG